MFNKFYYENYYQKQVVFMNLNNVLVYKIIMILEVIFYREGVRYAC